jgi:branched-chain amino acid transport system substrate-binding protein
LLVKAVAEQQLKVDFYTYYGGGPGAPTAMGTAAIERVKVIWRWSPDLPIEKERKAAEEFKRRYAPAEYYAMPINNVFEMLASAINKSDSTDPLRVAYALEDLRIQGSMGEVWMRRDDHQLFEPLYILTCRREWT